jgi:hypothetical protein
MFRDKNVVLGAKNKPHDCWPKPAFARLFDAENGKNCELAELTHEHLLTWRVFGLNSAV